ncbi:hypothetical protein [Streptomyces sp. JW3]|uniref:hypothetical protein n=1 Tax=Streptomyces sp. JW3 TaxID=3456955 RepID=UPI003FA4159C
MDDWVIPLTEEILTDAEDDWVPVDDLLAITSEYAESAAGDAKEISIEFLRSLLLANLMDIGDLGESGFEAWKTSIDDSLVKFIDGCSRLDWEPQGALWWLAITPRGREWLTGKRKLEQ